MMRQMQMEDAYLHRQAHPTVGADSHITYADGSTNDDPPRDLNKKEHQRPPKVQTEVWPRMMTTPREMLSMEMLTPLQPLMVAMVMTALLSKQPLRREKP